MVVVYMAFSAGVGFVTSWYALILHYIIPEGDIFRRDMEECLLWSFNFDLE